MATPFKVNRQDISTWILLYESGLNHLEIAEQYSLSPSTIYYHLKKQGFTLRRNGGKTGNKNGQWKEIGITGSSLHRWVKKRIPKPSLCPDCMLRPPLDLANISPTYNPDTYTRELSNWEWLCRKCHMVKDGRLDKLVVSRIGISK